MIAKKIHYCWFGGNPKSEIIQRCIASWKKYCPDYEIIEWNESNFDINCIPYTAAAYADKKWAFVSDYARLKIIYENGGVYLDTDVLLHNSIDELLKHDCWLASDDVRYVATGLGFGAVKGHYLIKQIAEAYLGYPYPSGTNVIRDTKIVEQLLPIWQKSDRNQVLNDILLIGLKDYGTYATHLYTCTWADEKTQQKREDEINADAKNRLSVRLLWKTKCFFRQPRFIAYFDQRRGSRAEKFYTFFAYDFLDYGPWYYIKRVFAKLRK